MTRGWLILGLCGLLTGCVERRFVIYSQAPEMAGATVLDPQNNRVGSLPVDVPFTYYGKYDFKIIKDGFETQTVSYQAKTPWYELPLLDFISENLLPFNIRDIHYVAVQPVPLQPFSGEGLIQQGQILRDRGEQIGRPLPKQ